MNKQTCRRQRRTRLRAQPVARAACHACPTLSRIAPTLVARAIGLAVGMSCRRLEGKVAVVTAATAGIGQAIAERLGQEGAKVFICSRSSA